MIRKLFVVFFIFSALNGLWGQVVKVIAYDTKTSVPQAAVYNSTKKIFLHTNEHGEVDLKIFHLKDTIYFVHPDYEITRTTKQDIIMNRYRVELYRNLTVLNTVVLSVSRSERRKENIGKELKLFDSYQIEEQTVSELPELLMSVPGVSVQRSQGGGGSPVIRGLEANRILLVVDGVRMNNAIYRTGHLHNAITVAPPILERVEVIQGPSSIYGSDALGGVIHFITKTPALGSPKAIKGGFLGRFATATREATFHFNFTVSQKHWASITALTYSDFGDIRMGTLRLHGYDGWGIVHEYSDNTGTHYNPNPVNNPDLLVQPNTGYKQYDLFNKTVVATGKNARLIFDTQFHTTSDIPRFDKLTEYKHGHLKFAEWRYGPMQRLLFSPQWETQPGRKWLSKIRIIPAYQNIRESRIQRKFGSDIRSYKKEKLHVFSINVDATASLTRHLQVHYGLEAVHNLVSSNAYGKKLQINGDKVTGLTGNYYVPSRYPNAGSRYTSYAFYTDATKRLNNEHFVEAGLRFTQTFLFARWQNLQLVSLPFQQIDMANFAVTPMLSYIYSPRNWKISLNLGSGFRSPNIDDVGKIREKKGKLLVPNTGLKPEYSYSSELGIKRDFPLARLSVQSYVYYNIIHNFIDRQPFTLGGFSQMNYDGEMVDIYANVNNGNAHIYGFDLAADWQITQRIKWHADAAWLKGRKQNGDPMPSIPPWKVYSGLQIENDYFDLFFSGIYTGRKPLNEYDVKSSIDNLDESPVDPQTGQYTGFPDWYVFNLHFRFHLMHNLSLDLGVENIFDVHYKRFASAVSEPGRNLKIQISGRF